MELGAPCPDYYDQTPAETRALGEAWTKKERREERRAATIAGAIANVGAAFSGIGGGGGVGPEAFLPVFKEEESEKLSQEEIDKRQSALRAAGQRALAAGLSAAFKKK